MMEIGSEPLIFNYDCCKITFKTLFQKSPQQVVTSTMNQSGKIGDAERQFRITGSRCYSIFTYNKNDWSAKSLKYFWPKSFTNKNMMYGKKCESKARLAFSQLT